LFYYLVWSTKGREPLITQAVAAVLERSVRASCDEQQVLIHAFGTMPDHVHLAASIPPALAIAKVVGRLKGAATDTINETVAQDDHFAWQAEYGALSFGEKNLPAVVAYVTNQPARHAAGRLWPTLEVIDPAHLDTASAKQD
jgi:REP element-mobilizing transposase RayT